MLKNPKALVTGVQGLIEENKKLQKLADSLNKKVSEALVVDLITNVEEINGVEVIAAKVDVDTAVAKNMAFSILKDNNNVLVVLGNEAGGKAFLTVAVGEELINENGLNAGNIIRELAKEIKGGGGGQPHFATAGGKDPAGIQKALAKVKDIL